jgi:hypothetical protein
MKSQNHQPQSGMHNMYRGTARNNKQHKIIVKISPIWSLIPDTIYNVMVQNVAAASHGRGGGNLTLHESHVGHTIQKIVPAPNTAHTYTAT